MTQSRPTPLPADLPPLDVAPGPRVAEPLPADRPVRWGILATGKIARGFAANLALLPDAAVVAVGARRAESAQAFVAEQVAGRSDRCGPARAYGGYAGLVADPDVDVVYVASPHALHHEHVLLAFEAGKAVLCEKSLTLNAAQAEELVAVARERRLFLMEAMWMRCNPLVRRVRQLLAGGALGQIRQVRADLGFRVDAPPTDRLLDPLLGGGALLDMGIYPLTFAQLFLGDPTRVAAVASVSPAGIDLDLALALGYANGATASLSTTMTAPSPRTASVATEVGRFDFPEPFHHPAEVRWTSAGHTEVVTEPVIGSGLAHEALEVIRCLRNGEVESPLMTWADSLSLMRQMDAIRRDVGVRYAADGADPPWSPTASRRLRA